MTSDDNHDDDAQLQQLRAVWVSMREEDPPDRGLAALMAAARTKAAELEQAASPSWWQRIAATLRRPPVLALATVTLLLGGALIVTQRKDKMAVEETADVRAKGEYAAPAAGSSAVLERGIQAPAAEPEPTKPAEVTTTPTTEPPAVRDAKPAPKTKPKAATAGPTATTKPTDLDAPKADKSDAFEAGEVSGGAGGAASPPVLSIAQDDIPAATGQAESAKQGAKKPIARKAAPSIEGEDRVTTKDAAKPTLDQLVKQCETAAARGDCATVREIAQKILTTAPSAYKSRVTSNAAINRCMPDAAPNAVAQ